MPSRERRREVDLRASRFESEYNMAEFQREDPFRNKPRQRLPYCNRCQRTFEEKSKVCPRCDRKDEMGYLTRIPERHREEARRNAFRRLGVTPP